MEGVACRPPRRVWKPSLFGFKDPQGCFKGLWGFSVQHNELNILNCILIR